MAYKSTKHLSGLVPGQSNVALLVNELVLGGEALEGVVGHPALVAEVGHAGLALEGDINIINDISTVCGLVLQKVPSEFYPKVCNHGEGPY